MSEYTAITREILQYQRLRVQILAFTVAALGVLVGLPVNGVLKEMVIGEPDIINNVGKVMYTLVFLGFAPYIVIIPSAVLTGILCQHILVLDAYIAVRHEAESGYLGWTLTRYAQERYRDQLQIRRGFRTTSALGYTIAYFIMGFFAFFFSCFFGQSVFRLLGRPSSWDSNNMFITIMVGALLLAAITVIILMWIASIRPRVNKEKRMKGFMDARQLLQREKGNLIGWLASVLERSSRP